MTRMPWGQRRPVVYTMGKVGSTSLSTAIRHAGLPCHDIHTLDLERLKAMAKQCLEEDRLPPPHVCDSLGWIEHGLLDTRRCTYITAVRDPVERNLSAFFQNLPEGDHSPARLFDRFLETYPHDLPVTWFEDEFRRFLDIDVPALPFDKTARLYRDKRQLFIMRLDANPGAVEAELSEAVAAPIRLRRDNTASKSPMRSFTNP